MAPSLRRTLAVCSWASLAVLVEADATATGGGAGTREEPSSCDAVELEYALSANLELSDTPLGQGDGVYPVGPGRAVIRFEARDGHLVGPAKMLVYEMREHFAISAKTLFWRTTVTTDAVSRATPDRCGVTSEGTLVGHSLRWTTPMNGYRTDGTLTCDGSLCGRYGAPAPGRSPLHIGPGQVAFNPFDFSPDMQTFNMPRTYAERTDMPKQTAHIAVSGRQQRRSCVSVPPCP